MPGGTLHIEIADDGQIHMTGPVEGTFEGCFHKDLLERIRNPKSETSTNDPNPKPKTDHSAGDSVSVI